MKISALIAQFPVTLSIPRNLEIIDSILAGAAPGDLVILPEGCVSGYSTDTSFLQEIDQTGLAAALAHLQYAAGLRKLNLWAGACINQAGEWFNAAYGFFSDGTTRVYHKINLANHERGVFTPGDHLPVFEMPFPGGNVTVGVQICRELRFPEQWGWLARSGAQLFLHLNNATGDDSWQPVWRSHLVSRAAETQRFVLSANNAAPQQISPTIAIGPDGKVIDEIISPEVGVLRVELDLARVSNLYLEQARTDVVAFKPARPVIRGEEC